MDFIKIIQSIILGIIEGITEWLPISSTGHLILANKFMNIGGKDFFNSQMFLYVIQLGAILAVVTLYFKKLNPFALSKSKDEKKATWSMLFKIVVGCIPAGIIGLWLNDYMDKLESAFLVSLMLIIYGVAFILVEKFQRKHGKITSMDDMTYKTALLIGVFQVMSIIPGTSRSGATILGAIILGCSRTVAAEFTFFMAIPIMAGVSFIKIITNDIPVTAAQWGLLAISFAVSYVVSVVSIKFLMNYVRNHDFKFFGWYRIVLGIIVIGYFYLLPVLVG